MIFAPSRGAEKSHDTVTQEFIHEAPFVLDGAYRQGQKAIEKLADLFRGLCGAAAAKTANVDKKDGDFQGVDLETMKAFHDIVAYFRADKLPKRFTQLLA